MAIYANQTIAPDMMNINKTEQYSVTTMTYQDIFNLPFNNSDIDVNLIDESSVVKLNNSDVNSTQINNITFPIIPFSILFWYLICANGSGVLFNGLLISDLFRRKCTNGIFTLLIQLAISDILLLTLVAVPEMWSHNGGSWIFGSEMCVVYLGFEVFSSTSNVYFLIAICFHAVTTVNVLLKNINKTKDAEEQLLDDMTEIKSSRHSLVSRNNDSLPLNKATDMYFRNNKTNKIPVIIPVILVWILAASLSVPEFALSTTIVTRNGPNICTFIDGQKFNNVRILLSIFQLFIPMSLLVILMIIMIFRMYGHVWKLAKDVTEMLKLSISLQILYFVLNSPRFILSSIHVLSYGNKNSSINNDSDLLDIFKTPPLNNVFAHEIVMMLLSFFYFMSSILRPLFYFCFLRSTRCKNKSNSKAYCVEVNE